MSSSSTGAGNLQSLTCEYPLVAIIQIGQRIIGSHEIRCRVNVVICQGPQYNISGISTQYDQLQQHKERNIELFHDQAYNQTQNMPSIRSSSTLNYPEPKILSIQGNSISDLIATICFGSSVFNFLLNRNLLRRFPCIFRLTACDLFSVWPKCPQQPKFFCVKTDLPSTATIVL